MLFSDCPSSSTVNIDIIIDQFQYIKISLKQSTVLG